MPGTDFLLPVSTAVKAIGQRPRVELFALVAGLELEEGRLKVDPETGQTTNPKYFSAGDATNGEDCVAALRNRSAARRQERPGVSGVRT
jgi:glutamate synthase (NADPH/NADH) small chain